MEYFDFHHHKPCQPGIYNLNISETPPSQPFSAGILPQDFFSDNEENLRRLAITAQDKNCIAIGECGLDARVSLDDAQQEKFFLRQTAIAENMGKPVLVHCVRKFPQLLRIKKKTGVKMALHGFNKKKETARELLANGFYLSFGAALLQNVSLQKIFLETPMDRFFLETDAAQTEIGEVYEFAASLKSTTAERVQEIIFENLESYRK